MLLLLSVGKAVWPPVWERHFYACPSRTFFRLFLLFVVAFGDPKQNQGRELVARKLVQAPSVILLLAVRRRLFCFESLVILDVVCCYLLLFLLYI